MKSSHELGLYLSDAFSGCVFFVVFSEKIFWDNVDSHIYDLYCELLNDSLNYEMLEVPKIPCDTMNI